MLINTLVVLTSKAGLLFHTSALKMQIIVFAPYKNALENYGISGDFVLVCVRCKMLFISIVLHQLISFFLGW